MSDTSPLPIPAADPFLALLTGCQSAAASLSTSVPALASLTADLVARNNESIKVVLAQVTSLRSALLARKTRVQGSAKRLSRKQCKRILDVVEVADVSTEQLRVSAVAGTGAVCPDLDCVFAASPLFASPRLAHAPVAGVCSVFGLAFSGELGSVATGDGLRVVSTVGPGLKWFDPHSRNEFSVVLAQADGSAPFWLTAGDVAVSAFSPDSARVAAGVTLTATAARSECLRQILVCVDSWGLNDDAPEAVLRMTVCGVAVADAAGASDWCVRVPRKLLAGHACAAVGTYVKTLAVVGGGKRGLAVSADEKWLVVGLEWECTLTVYLLPVGEFVRTFGGRGVGPLQFRELRRLCFAPNGNLFAADGGNNRLQEVTLEGVFVRFIGVGEFSDGSPFGVAVRDDVIAVGCEWGHGPRVVLFDFDTGAVTSRFGSMGHAPGQLSPFCTGIRFTPDGSHVVVAEASAQRLSVFTVAGVFVSCVGAGSGVLAGSSIDVLLSVRGEYMVTDETSSSLWVFSADGAELVRSWGVAGLGDGGFEFSMGTDDFQAVVCTAFAAAGQHLYVVDNSRVQVFE